MIKCSHNVIKLAKINTPENCVFCQNCGIILFPSKNDKYSSTIKPIENESKTETDPIDIFLNSYKSTPFIPIQKDCIYAEKRPRAIKIINKLNKLYNYKEEIFFLALTYMDYIFKSIYSSKDSNLTNKQEELYIINCLYLAEKFYDTDITTPPDFNLYLENSIYSVEILDIREYEVSSLKILKYKLDQHSIYDILSGYMYNGFIFEKEIDINSIYQLKFAYNYADKIFRDIIVSNIAIFYPPYLVAFVIIQLTRKKFFDNKYMKKIKKFYGIKNEDYKECYEEVKTLLSKTKI